MQIYVQSTFQSWTKVCNCFPKTSEPPHPRFNDEAKTEGQRIIEPGVRGIIIELGVRGFGENREREPGKKLQIFVHDGRILG